MLVQQSEECQQHSATTATATTSAVSASGHIRAADLLRASRRHRHIQLPAVTTTTTTSNAISSGTSSTTSTTSATSTTRVSTPGPIAYNISAINNEDICEGGQPLGIGSHRRLFNITSTFAQAFLDLQLSNLCARFSLLSSFVDYHCPASPALHVALTLI